MKNIIPFLVLFLLACQGTKSQSPIEMSEATLDFGNSSIPGFSVTIPEADYENTMKNWVKQLESGTRSKVVTADDGLSIFGAKIKSISDNPVNVFSKLTAQDSAINLDVAFEMEKDKYAGSSELSGAREYLVEFAVNQYLDIVNGQIAVEDKKLRELKSDLKSLERSQSRMKKSISSNEDQIRDNEEKLAELNNELAMITYELTRSETGGMGNQGAVSDPDRLKDLEKQEKKIRKEIRSIEKKLGNSEVEVSQDERAIPRNVSDQEDAKYLVEEQEAVVRQLENKRDAIKNYR